MIIYTDLHNRTKNYSLSEQVRTQIERDYDVTITTDMHPLAEIYWGDKITDMHIMEMSRLKWIHLSKTGFGKFNLPDHIKVTNTPDSSNGVAEYAVTGVLYLLRGLHNMPLDRSAFDSRIDNILPFNEVKCLIVGHGRIGKLINRKLTGLSMKVEYITRSTTLSDIDYSKYNFIINTLPLNSDTGNYFDKNIFGRMNKNSYIVNVGRGETINERDLYSALQKGDIRGAFLDVVQDEPIQSTNSLLKLDNVFISPHIANALHNALDTQVKAFINNLERYKSNEILENRV